MAGRTGINASVKRFQRVMAALPKQVEKAADEILARQAASLADQIRSAAPAASGALRRSVKSVKGKKPLSYYVVAGGSTTTPGSGTFIGEFRNALAKSRRGKAAGLSGQGLYDYARAIEFGTSDGRRAEPFFYTTYRRNRKAMKRYLAEQCAKALKDGFDNA